MVSTREASASSCRPEKASTREPRSSMVIGASSSAATALASANRSPTGHPADGLRLGLADVALGQQAAQHGGQLRPGRAPGQPEQGHPAVPGGRRQLRGERHRGAQHQRDGAPARRGWPAARRSRPVRAARHRAPGRCRAGRDRRAGRGWPRRRCHGPGPGRRGSTPAGWRRGRPARGRGWPGVEGSPLGAPSEHRSRVGQPSSSARTDYRRCLVRRDDQPTGSHSVDVVTSASTSGSGATPRPGPVGTGRCPSASTNGSVTSVR